MKNKKTEIQNKSMPSSPSNHNNGDIAPIYKSMSFSSPLPPPQLLEDYEKRFAGSVEKIINMIEVQGSHRRYLEKNSLDANIGHLKKRDNEAIRGQIFGFIIGVLGISCATIAAIFGFQIFGSVIGIGTLSSMVIAFIKGRDFDLKDKVETGKPNES